MSVNSIAYIPLQRENTRVGPSHWGYCPTREFCVGDTNMLVSKNAKICVTPNANAKICVTPKVEYSLRGVRQSWVAVEYRPNRFFLEYGFCI